MDPDFPRWEELHAVHRGCTEVIRIFHSDAFRQFSESPQRADFSKPGPLQSRDQNLNHWVIEQRWVAFVLFATCNGKWSSLFFGTFAGLAWREMDWWWPMHCCRPWDQVRPWERYRRFTKFTRRLTQRFTLHNLITLQNLFSLKSFEFGLQVAELSRAQSAPSAVRTADHRAMSRHTLTCIFNMESLTSGGQPKGIGWDSQRTCLKVRVHSTAAFCLKFRTLSFDRLKCQKSPSPFWEASQVISSGLRAVGKTPSLFRPVGAKERRWCGLAAATEMGTRGTTQTSLETLKPKHPTSTLFWRVFRWIRLLGSFISQSLLKLLQPASTWQAGNRFRIYAVAKTGPDRQVSRRRPNPGQGLPFKLLGKKHQRKNIDDISIKPWSKQYWHST